MRVLVTGGAGHIGLTTVKLLKEWGLDVHAVDLQPELNVEGISYAQCNITNYDDLLENMRGCQGVVHLAAFRTPHLATAPELYRVNTTGTFNVFEAAAKLGIKRVVHASSINAIGCSWNIKDMDIHYFPIDEDHPMQTIDPYSFSKQVGEEIGDYYWRREGISSIALRLPAVVTEEGYFGERFTGTREFTVETMDKLAGLPDDEIREYLREPRELTLQMRGDRIMEMPPGENNRPQIPEIAPIVRVYFLDRFNFWTYVDIRDAVQAIYKGLTADYAGSHPLFINDSYNWLNYDSEVLLRVFFPEVTARKRPIPGAATLVSIDKARDLIGFEPEYNLSRQWRKLNENR